MFKIDEIRIENTAGCPVTDNPSPVLSFSLYSDRENCSLSHAVVRIGDWERTVAYQTGIVLDGIALCPFTRYEAEVTVFDDEGNEAKRSTFFCMGRLHTAWAAKWITDAAYKFADRTSPVPFTFRKKFYAQKRIKRAFLTATALGIYELSINGKKVGNEYFAPGFTSYKKSLQYNFYDVTDMLGNENTVIAVVGGGWAVGRFTYESKSKITCDRQAFLMELFLEYGDGTKEKVITDSSWQVTREGNFRFGDFYDGELYDATVNLDSIAWKSADVYKPKFKTRLSARYGCAVTVQETLKPKECYPAKNGRETIYDFGQNFAGVISLKINGKHGQKITIRHAELLQNGNLCVKSLRTAKATAIYICTDGEQTYSPRLTYMGFRYIGIEGIGRDDIEAEAFVLHSDFEEIGTFECSNPLLNKLQSNIRWSGRSNFVEIPTDCPQRDERQGWTGDISVFASTACYNFNLSRFLDKWLHDVMLEQGRGGGIPMVVPKQGNGAPTVATACWGDCCILVSYAEYLSRGNKELLKKQYPAMKKFLKAVKFWAGLSGIGKYKRHIWKWLFQFGDWCAPGEGIKDWMGKGKWVATAYYANSCAVVSKVASLLGYERDAAYYSTLHDKISRAYQKVFTDGNGTLAREFQTGYVLPLYFHMADGNVRTNMAKNLHRLVEEQGYHLSTGFTGTPYLLFALADNGYTDTAYQLLLQDTCPSWLYCVKAGATTTWEQWDALRPDGSVNMDNLNGSDVEGENSMVSFNHYAYGAVGDFLYRRVLGLEADEGGYRRFTVKPVLGGGLAYAKGSIKTPYGLISVDWSIVDGTFGIEVQVPVSTQCRLVLPSGKEKLLPSGRHSLQEETSKFVNP